MGHNPSSPGAWRPTLGPGKASFCFNFTVSSRHPEQLPICKGGSGGPSWETRRHGRGGIEKMQPKMVRRDGEGKMGQGPERTGIRRRKRWSGPESAHLWAELLEVQADPRQLQQLVEEGRGLVHIHGRCLAWVSHGLVAVL